MSAANFYSDSKFGVISRKWFGLTKKVGGDVAAGYTFGTAHGTTITHLARWYPRGPVKLLKGGSFVLATVSQASSGILTARVKTRGASASVGCSWSIAAANPWVFASSTSFTVSQVKAGEYIQVMTATCKTAKGTRVQSTTTGTVAFFVDYVPTFDQSGKWQV